MSVEDTVNVNCEDYSDSCSCCSSDGSSTRSSDGSSVVSCCCISVSVSAVISSDCCCSCSTFSSGSQDISDCSGCGIVALAIFMSQSCSHSLRAVPTRDKIYRHHQLRHSVRTKHQSSHFALSNAVSDRSLTICSVSHNWS